jgi:adenylate cyclase
LSLPITALILTILSIYFVNMSYGYFIESKAKRDFTALFGQYVPAKLVEEMSRDPSKYSMEGQKKELTILFTDIVGFTPVSEKLKPVELSRYVNRYLTELSQIISDHEGTIDKYIGDAIMAFWGAPVDNPRHRERAVLAAIKMQERVFEISQEYAADGWPPLKVAIGVATGEVVVGDMGSTIRRAYTVIGDTVNLAARLEAATRQYGVSTLIADSTADGVDNIQFREIDSVRVKGKIIPVKIFEPIRIKTGDAPSPNTEMQKWTALLASYRSQQWVECERLLMELENENPEEMRYKKFRERIEKYREVSNWDGITTLESK